MWHHALKSLATSLVILIIVVTHAPAEPVNTVDQQASQSVISDQIAAFQETDYERAFSHAAPNIRQAFQTTDQFIAMVRSGYTPLIDPDFYTFGRKIFQLGEIYQEVFVTDGTGKQWQVVYTLKKQQDGSWKITGVKMEPYQGSST